LEAALSGTPSGPVKPGVPSLDRQDSQAQHSSDEMTVEPRDQVIARLPPSAQQRIKCMLSAAGVADFLLAMEQLCRSTIYFPCPPSCSTNYNFFFPNSFNGVRLKRLDKKRERTLIHILRKGLQVAKLF